MRFEVRILKKDNAVFNVKASQRGEKEDSL
jgi:hypothetical protein